MIGGIIRTFSDCNDLAMEPDDFDSTIVELLDKFFKVILKNRQPIPAIAHTQIQKKAGELSYAISLKGNTVKTDCVLSSPTWILK